MKYVFFFLIVFFLTFNLHSQVGIGNTNPDASSIFDVTADDKGVLVPRVSLSAVTETQLDGINTAATGLLIFNNNPSTVGGSGVGFYYFNGTSWERLITSETQILDHDWYEEGTTSSPTDINSDKYTLGNIAIGKNIASYRLDIEEATGARGINAIIRGTDARPIYGGYFSNENTGNGSHFGLYAQLTGTGNGFHFGSYNNINSGGSGSHYGIYNYLQGTGTGTLRGVENNFASATALENTGVYNTFSVGNVIDKGIQNDFLGASAGDKIGLNNIFSTTSNSSQYGMYSNFTTATGSNLQYGTVSKFGGTSSGLRIGNQNLFEGSGTGTRYGFVNEFTGSYGGPLFGVSNFFQTTGSNPILMGINNSFSGAGTGNIIGVQNNVTNSNNSVHYGMYNNMLGDNANSIYGISNKILGSSSGQMFGTMNEVNNTGSGRHIGNANLLGGSGSGNKFGSYNTIYSFAGGTHYGVYSSVLKAGSFAGFFAGNVAIGTTEENNASPNYYIMPASRGTNNQIMQTDGSGNVGWVDPNIASQAAALKVGSTTNITGLVNNTETLLFFNQIVHNLGGGMYLPGSGTYTIPASGVYNVTSNFNVSFAGAATNQMVLAFRIYKNGILLQQIANGSSAVLGATFPFQTFSFTNDFQLSAGDILTFRVVPVWNGGTPAPSILGANSHILIKKVF